MGAIYFAAAASILLGVLLRQLPGVALLGVLSILGVALPWLKNIFQALGPESVALSQCRVKAAQIHLISGLVLVVGFGSSVLWRSFFG